MELAHSLLAELRRSLRSSRFSGSGKNGFGRSRTRDPIEFSGPHTDERDPVLLGPGLTDLISSRGWQGRTAVASVIGRWPEIAGPDLAAHVLPEAFEEDTGVLRLRAESTTWATQVKILTPALMSRIDEQIGSGLVRQIEVLGPKSARRGFGPWRVAGRGPRDTYG